MNKKFGNIPEEILGIELKEFESNTKTLAHMISDTTDEDIIEAKYSIHYSNKGPEIQTFTAWTENYEIKLKFTQLGYFMFKTNRLSSTMYN